MEDLSSVVNFFALGWEDVGNDGNTSLDFLGPRALRFEISFGAPTRTGVAGEMDIVLSISAVF